MTKNIFSNLVLNTLLCLPLIVYSQSSAEKNQGKVAGKIMDSSQFEVVYASVSLFQNNTTLVNNGISNENGEFIIPNIEPGTYYIQVNHYEFEIYNSDSFTISENEIKTIPDIILKATTNSLDEVVVTRKKQLIEVKADKIIYNVASSPSASGTNGLDLLKKAPGVTLGINNEISLLGKKNVQVYLNGVQSRLSGDDLTTFLQSLTSDIIDSIEIISNPSSKYDAEGTGGIINIRMKKNISTGFNGNITSSFTQGIETKYSNNLSMNFGSEKIKTNFDITQSQNNDLEYFNDGKKQNNSIFYLDSEELRIRKGVNVGLGIDAQLSENHFLSLTGRGLFNNNNNELNSITDIYQADPQEFEETLASQSYLDGKSSNYIANLNHFWNTSSSSTLSTNLSLGIYDTQRNTLQPNTYFEEDGTTVIRVEDNAFDADTSIDLWSGKVDYEKEWDKITVTTGIKYAQIKTTNGFVFYNIENKIPIYDPTKSNDFKYTENVAAFYANANWKIIPSLTLNAGLRIENTDSRGELISEIPIDNKDVPRNYTDFFPNIGLMYELSENHSFNLGFGKRITRPSYQDLNPFETPTSQLVVWKGNPFLKPNYITNYQLSYTFKQKLVITTMYSKTEDFFAKVIELREDGITQIIPRNMDQAINYGISLSYPATITKFWDLIFYGNASHQSFDGNIEGTVIDLEADLWDYSIQNILKLPLDFLVDLTFTQRSDWIWRGSAFIEGTYNLSFGIRKDFLDKRLQIRITGNDILRTETDYPYNSNYGGTEINGVYTDDNRRFGLGATYKFGNQKSKSKRRTKSALDDELNRIGD